uniref:Uncharacterized protein n=1 Tax=Leersia perrieri TaxID=77586 RepID=A0A0D9UZA9_9ORYZ
MASGNGSDVRVLSRSLVKASDESIQPHVLPVSNLDLLPQTIQVSLFCIYPNPPPTANFRDVVAAFTAGLPSLLNYYFPLTGRIVTDPVSGIPEIHCYNQGAELVVGDAADVALSSLDYATVATSIRKVMFPYAADVALSVQVVSFACGGFTVSWCTNHVVVDGCALSALVSAWAELARSGTWTLPPASWPRHDRSVFRPHAAPSHCASLDAAFTPLDGERQVNVLTTDESFVGRLYYIDASDIARLRDAASRDGDGEQATRVQAVSAYLWKALAAVVGDRDARCRMGWWVDGRRRLTSQPELRNYVGNVVTFTAAEASVEEINRKPLPEVASMVRDAIAAPAPASSYDERFQEIVDWVEEHKGDKKRYIETVSIGLGSPAVNVTAFSSFAVDTDFGFGHAAMALPTSSFSARLCSAFVQIVARPGCDGSWIASAFVWPRLAAALEAGMVFKPVTTEYLGLRPASAVNLADMITSKI